MRILLPIDGSELALHEVRFAIRLVQDGLRADFLLTNVQEPASLYEMVVVPDPEALGTISHDAGEHILQEACRLLDAHGLAYETEIVTGDPVQALVELIEQCLAQDPRPAYQTPTAEREYGAQFWDLDVRWHYPEPGRIRVLEVVPG